MDGTTEIMLNGSSSSGSEGDASDGGTGLFDITSRLAAETLHDGIGGSDDEAGGEDAPLPGAIERSIDELISDATSQQSGSDMHLSVCFAEDGTRALYAGEE